MTDTPTAEATVALPHWGLIRARGVDAAAFLQGQLTNDVITLDASSARLAGFCSAKGRLQASFVVIRSAADEFLLACAASVLPATLKRLSMFVLRAKCALDDPAAQWGLRGAFGSAARARCEGLPVWGRRLDASGTWVRLPDVDGVERCLLIAAREGDTPMLAADETAALHTWRELEVRSGVPLIEAATVDAFVPQMLNYELIGGVDFRKGCYPGQEVVARSQYRGTIKRRMFLFGCDGAASAGQEVFHSLDAGQPAGRVVNAAARHGGGAVALIEVKLAALDAGNLNLGTPDGAMLERLELPYPVSLEAGVPGG